MKKIIFILLFYSFSTYSSNLDSLRTSFISASFNKHSCDIFGDFLKSISASDSPPLITGYEACYYLINCKFLANPFKKMKNFRIGKDMLESAIKNDPESVELRFLRYSIQKNIPIFLSYSNNLEKDLKFVKDNISQIFNYEFRIYISSSINK